MTVVVVAVAAGTALLAIGSLGVLSLSDGVPLGSRSIAAMLGCALVAALAGIWAARRLVRANARSLMSIRHAIERYVDGDIDARSNLMGEDESSRLSQAVDALLDAAGATQAAAVEPSGMNDSVVEIMRAVGEIAATKNLAIRIPVNEDVTGAIADALNLLTDETGRVLGSVSAVSRDVAQASIAVKNQSDLAIQAAAREQREVGLAARELAQAAAALNAIADRARGCNEAAERAVAATTAAVLSVDGTVDGVSASRELIRETEKRIKRLGERSQEIGQVVGMIQSIAERTGILALNASMHAAAAGEAGRSFAAVADEVRRLSESARDATGQIGRMITAIQTETGDTVRAMSLAITKVVEISRLADEAGAQMRRNQRETEALAGAVRDIARTSGEQAKVGAGLQERARIIQESSQETGRQLSGQSVETRRLVEYARALIDEVGVFKLPHPKA